MIHKPSPCNPLHIYRALLRECTYLPDPAARTYWHSRIVARFREYNPHPNIPWWELPKNPKIKHVNPASRIELLHTARKYLSTLARANLGVTECLETVLAHTYGRTGKRCHELLAQLEAQNVPVLKDHEAVMKLSAALAETADKAPQPTEGFTTHSTTQPTGKPAPSSSKPTLATFRASPLLPALQALLKAQRLQSLPTDRRAINTPSPQIPALNSWQRSFPICRARNIQKRWHKEALDTLLPPLPLHEFERLRDLATGKAQWGGAVPRRRGMEERAGGLVKKRALQDNEPDVQAAKFGRKGEIHPRIQAHNPHHLTPRLMRRYWRTLLTQCSTMHFDALNNKWKVTWGKDVREESIRKGEGLGGKGWMFEGVDEAGKMVRVGS